MSHKITADTINRCGEINTFIPALAYTFAQNPVEIEVAHEERFAGESKYSLYSLIRLNFDLVTGFSVVPLQWLSFIGVILSLGSAALFVLLLIRRFIVGAEVQGVFTLFAITFFLLGVIIFALGLSLSGLWYLQVGIGQRGLGEGVGFVKVVADAEHNEILGAHLIGPDVTELLPELVLAQMWDLTAHEVGRAIHAHPTLSEALKEAAEGIEGHMTNL